MKLTDKVLQVFLSSTIKGKTPDDPGLEPYREKIRKMITSEFGWKCICSEENNVEFWGSNVSACLNAVGSADLYIGIFWKRYGTIITDSGLPLTEMEFYRALNLRKPMKIYVIESDQREPSLQLFLDWIKHNQFLVFCKTGELREKIRVDLEYFGKKWPSKKILSTFVPPSYLDEILKKLDLLPLELDVFDTKPRTGTFDKDFVLKKLENMKIFHTLYDYEVVIREGWEVLNMLRFRPPYKYKEFRGILISFLLLWENSCNWYGYIEGPFGSFWAAKSLREIYRLREAWSLLNSAASIVSSNIYAIATLKQSKSMFIKISFYRGGTVSSAIWSIRGNINRKLGDFDEAIKCHLMARNRCTSDEGEGIQLSHLGRAKILKGDKEGLRDLEEGVKLCYQLPSPSSVRTLKALGQGLIKLRKLYKAEDVMKMAHEFAKERKLGHQLKSIEAMQELIKNKKKGKAS